MQISVIAIGTELTSGQIINRNALWLSKALKDLGVPTRCHLVVPDDRGLILDALKFCAQRSDTIFVTGGLGPTTDDFTRELISEWSGKSLVFHEPSWSQIQQRLGNRGIQIREMQRQQCFFPEGAQVITNPEGTANAFHLEVEGVDVFVLPGPPKEIEAIWNHGLGDVLRAKAKDVDKLITYSWDTMGLGESDVADITERCLLNVEIEKGYRVHLPYVEVKVTFLESRKAELLPAVQKVEEALKAITVAKNGEQMPTLLAQQLAQVERIDVVDAATGAVLMERLTPAFRVWMKEKTWSFSSVDNGLAADPRAVQMLLKPVDSTRASCEIRYRGATFKDVFEAPLFTSKIAERKALFFAERALIFWQHMLKNLI